MGVFSRFAGKSIDDYIAQATAAGAVLVDVREPAEYRQGHIPGAINIPLGSIAEAQDRIADRDATLYVYCAASAPAASSPRWGLPTLQASVASIPTAGRSSKTAPFIRPPSGS